ncbi:GSCOCG00002574001-RA-CDS [Cotesia congregata]|nr:GSCOCG00002574001-RA-CDS [Cotesia congregata]
MQVGRRVGARSESEDTLTPVKKVNGKLPVIGDAKGASEIDIQVVNLLYNCPKCGRTIQETSGVIKSPVTPESLYSNQVIECEWRMLAPHGHRIKFAITSLDIYETADCATDYLEIADGYSDDKALRRKFCRTGNEASLHSTDNRMLVKYRKSGESTHKGFTAQYQQTCNHTIFVDGKTVHLESPNYPEPYGANQQCFWRLVAPENHQLAVKLDFVELENEEDNCSLKFDDGRTETSACALDKAAEYFSSDNYLNVTFIPRSTGRNGFSISVAVKILV